MKLFPTFLGAALSLACAPTFADSANHSHHKHSPDSHAPISVMGDHMHKKGEWMFSYRFMQMNMEDNIRGSKDISADDIVSQVSNPNPGPANVRVVPIEMTTDMHMFGLMYAPNDQVTLMLMLNYLDKSMDHVTYMGMAGTNVLGSFTTETSGIGDTKVAALWRLYQASNHKLHLNIGMSLPTGSTDEEGDVLTPMSMRPTIRLPYPMQLGSGTYDFEPGITYTGSKDKLGWGAQYKASLRTGDNDEGYTLGDKHVLSAWSSYRVHDSVSLSISIEHEDEGRIDGRDDQIMAPVQTANPNNFGGTLSNLSIGLNYVGQEGWLNGQRIAFEYHTALHQDANGVQMKMQDMLTLGYQYAF